LRDHYPTIQTVQIGGQCQALAAVRVSRDAVVSDHRLPFRSESFDLILSNMVWHWSADRRALLRNWQRVLRPGGLLLLSTLASESLVELRQAMATVEQQRGLVPAQRWLSLPTLGDWAQLMTAAGLQLVVVDREKVTLSVPSVVELLHRLQRLGSVNPHHASCADYPGRLFWAEVEQCYRQQQGLISATAVLPVTLEVVFGHGWRSEQTQK
jgi:malonyl-CoA O-methyltransferase